MASWFASATGVDLTGGGGGGAQDESSPTTNPTEGGGGGEGGPTTASATTPTAFLGKGLGKLGDWKNKVQSAIRIDDDLVEALTLRTASLTAERQQIDDEERRKEAVRDSLAGMYPWETRDEEREILVDECKDAILALSSAEGTFTGPYALPKGKSPSEVAAAAANPHAGEAGEGGGDDGALVMDDDEAVQRKLKQEAAAEFAKAKLAKLEPLPTLLDEFDLDTHVGLIQRMLDVDPDLVEMQAQLSGAGEREKLFWKNYFVHCAYARYEAGLSIDEVWNPTAAASSSSSLPPQPGEALVGGDGIDAGGGADHPENVSVSGERAVAASSAADGGDEDEEVVTFETASSSAAASVSDAGDVAAASSSEAQDAAYDDIVGAAGAAAAVSAADGHDNASSPAGSTDYEIIGGSGEAPSAADDEMDELEAEIARELED